MSLKNVLHRNQSTWTIMFANSIATTFSNKQLSESWAFRKLISKVSIFTARMCFPIYIAGAKIADFWLSLNNWRNKKKWNWLLYLDCSFTFNPFTPAIFAEKCVFKWMERFCGHSSAIKIDLKLTGKPFPGCTLWPDPDVNNHFAKFSHAQQETFRDSFWV